MLYSAIDWVLRIIEYAIVARAIISWLPTPKDNQIIKLIFQITDPIILPIKNFIAKSSMGKNMMMDFSPIIAILLIEILRSFVRRFFS